MAKKILPASVTLMKRLFFTDESPAIEEMA
jgi:hypothetical protein